MTAYADTGFICSLLAPDANSTPAAAHMEKVDLPLPWTWLHELEFRNAMRLRVFRKELTQAGADRAIGDALADVASGIYSRQEPSLPSVAKEAERLSAEFSAKLGTRSLDVLHVAAALVLGLRVFLTFDKRQADLAKAAALRVPRL